jgi:deoxyribose-phosphate aldolase
MFKNAMTIELVTNQTLRPKIITHYPIDAVGLEERAQSFTKRSIKKDSKLSALVLAIEMMDLTTLEGADTAGKVKQMCLRAKNPFTPRLVDACLKHEFFKNRRLPHVAAVCVYPDMVPYAAEVLNGSGIQIASVSTAFPSGRAPLKVKIDDTKYAIENGATEIDMVIDRGAFLSGNYQKVFDEIKAIKEVCEDKAHLKVILETGELKTYDKIRLASWIAMEAGADFIKTSTGKIQPAATMPVTLLMLQAIQDFYDETGKQIGMKPAGGIRTAKQAIHYLCMINETVGSDWLSPHLFRFGASALLNDVLRQIWFLVTGTYADYESVAME